jgi:PAS domain S-box-containing protein
MNTGNMQPLILVVEDDIITARDLEKRLRRFGYDVCGVASSGEAAIILTEEHRPDLVIMDVRLSSALDGVQTAMRLGQNSHTPVIFLTGADDPEFLERMKGTRPFAYILKPCSDPEIQAAIEIALIRSTIEQDLRAQKQWLSAILDTVSDAVVALDARGRVEFLNLKAETLTGWTNREAHGQDVGLICPMEEPSLLTARDGTTHSVQMRSHILRNHRDEITGRVFALSDTSRQVTAESTQQALDTEYQILMEEASDAITITDPDGNYVAVNSRACELLGYSRPEFLQLNVHDIVPKPDLQTDPIHFDELRTGKTLIRERRLMRKDGTLIDVEISAKALTSGRLQAILRDISERKKADAEFKRAVRSEVLDRILTKLRAFSHGESSASTLNRLALFVENIDLLRTDQSLHESSPQQRFVAASDEFANFVSPQLSLLSSLLSIIEGDTEFSDVSASLQGSGQRMGGAALGLQEALVPLRLQLKSGLPLPDTAELMRIAVSIHDNIHTIQQCVSTATQVLRRRHTCIPASVIALLIQKFQAGAAAPPIVFSGSRVAIPAIIGSPELGEALSVLLQNSIEAVNNAHGNPEPQIIVRLTDHIERVRIEVEDTGSGISPETFSRLFDQGFSTKSAGRGFGLPHARNCVAKYGGSLHCDPHTSSGAKFVLELLKA